MINLLPWQQIGLAFAPKSWQSQIEKPRFETDTFVLNWGFHILIIPSVYLSEKQDQDQIDHTASKQKI